MGQRTEMNGSAQGQACEAGVSVECAEQLPGMSQAGVGGLRLTTAVLVLVALALILTAFLRNGAAENEGALDSPGAVSGQVHPAAPPLG